MRRGGGESGGGLLRQNAIPRLRSRKRSDGVELRCIVYDEEYMIFRRRQVWVAGLLEGGSLAQGGCEENRQRGDIFALDLSG